MPLGIIVGALVLVCLPNAPGARVAEIEANGRTDMRIGSPTAGKDAEHLEIPMLLALRG